jgi:hypothetical protein
MKHEIREEPETSQRLTKQCIRIRVGDRVYVQNMPVLPLEVVDTSDPSLIVLRAPNGATLKAGQKTIIKVETREGTI